MYWFFYHLSSTSKKVKFYPKTSLDAPNCTNPIYSPEHSSSYFLWESLQYHSPTCSRQYLIKQNFFLSHHDGCPWRSIHCCHTKQLQLSECYTSQSKQIVVLSSLHHTIYLTGCATATCLSPITTPCKVVPKKTRKRCEKRRQTGHIFQLTSFGLFKSKVLSTCGQYCIYTETPWGTWAKYKFWVNSWLFELTRRHSWGWYSGFELILGVRILPPSLMGSRYRYSTSLIRGQKFPILSGRPLWMAPYLVLAVDDWHATSAAPLAGHFHHLLHRRRLHIPTCNTSQRILRC